MTQNGFTETILDFDQVTGDLKRTGKKHNFDQPKWLLHEADPQLQVIYPDWKKWWKSTNKRNATGKTSDLVYNNCITLAESTTLQNDHYFGLQRQPQ